MDKVMAWGLILPLVTFLVSAGLILVARLKRWEVGISMETPTEIDSSTSSPESIKRFHFPSRENLKALSRRYQWEITLAAITLFIFIFAWIFSPPRIGNIIPLEPSLPGRPFFYLHWTRNYIRDNYDAIWIVCSILLSLFGWFLLGRAIRKRSRFRVEFALLCTSTNLACAAQWTLNSSRLVSIGILFYVFSALGFAIWAWNTRTRLANDLEPKTFSASVELWLVFGLLAVTTFGRLYELNSIPYGIEGDEAKWTAEAVDLGIRGKYDSSAEYHRDALPVSFYVQMPLQRLLGPGILPARLTVALLSILGTLVFYWLLRQIAPVPLAALSTYLLAGSIFDISTSRLANVESFVKLWPILALGLLALAVRKQRWQIYGLSGLALGLGMLTYDTNWPIFAVIMILSIVEMRHKRLAPLEFSRSFAALVTPTLLALPILIPYALSRTAYYDLGKKGWNSGFWQTLGENGNRVFQTWFVEMRSDFLYNRPGPLLNAILLPWLVLGVVISLWLLKKRYSMWNLIWLVFIIFPVPILANSQIGRVYYPGLPAIYAMIGLGIFLFIKEINRYFGRNAYPLLLAIFLVPLIWIPLFNQFIYYNEVTDASDRQMRREIGEFAAQAAGPDTMIFLPVILGADEPLNNEYQMLELFMLQKVPSAMVAQSYQRVALDSLLPGINKDLKGRSNAAVIMDKTAVSQRELRDQLGAALERCYPQAKITRGNFFDLYQINRDALMNSQCQPSILSLQFQSPPSLLWSLSKGRANSIQLTCQRQRTEFDWIEAEKFSLGAGWQTEVNFAPGWTGTGFVMDSYQSSFITYNLPPQDGKNLYVWIRFDRRKLDNSIGQVVLAGQIKTFANVDQNQLGQWVWQQLGPFQVDVGEAPQLVLSHPYNDFPELFMALFVDSVIVTNDSSFTPATGLYYDPFTVNFPYPQAKPMDSLDLRSLPQFIPGHYRCQASAFSSDPIVDSLGDTPVKSNEIEFEVNR